MLKPAKMIGHCRSWHLALLAVLTLAAPKASANILALLSQFTSPKPQSTSQIPTLEQTDYKSIYPFIDPQLHSPELPSGKNDASKLIEELGNQLPHNLARELKEIPTTPLEARKLLTNDKIALANMIGEFAGKVRGILLQIAQCDYASADLNLLTYNSGLVGIVDAINIFWLDTIVSDIDADDVVARLQAITHLYNLLSSSRPGIFSQSIGLRLLELNAMFVNDYRAQQNPPADFSQRVQSIFPTKADIQANFKRAIKMDFWIWAYMSQKMSQNFINAAESQYKAAYPKAPNLFDQSAYYRRASACFTGMLAYTSPTITGTIPECEPLPTTTLAIQATPSMTKAELLALIHHHNTKSPGFLLPALYNQITTVKYQSFANYIESVTTLQTARTKY